LGRGASGDEAACWFLPPSSHLVRTKRLQAVWGTLGAREAAAAARETVVVGGGDSFSADRPRFFVYTFHVEPLLGK